MKYGSNFLIFWFTSNQFPFSQNLRLKTWQTMQSMCAASLWLKEFKYLRCVCVCVMDLCYWNKVIGLPIPAAAIWHKTFPIFTIHTPHQVVAARAFCNAKCTEKWPQTVCAVYYIDEMAGMLVGSHQRGGASCRVAAVYHCTQTIEFNCSMIPKQIGSLIGNVHSANVVVFC